MKLREFITVLCFLPLTSMAENLLLNPEFDADLSGWTLDGAATPTFDPLDVDDSPLSGSAQITNAELTSSSEVVALSQCFETPLPGPYALALSGFIPSGQATSGSVIVRSSRFVGPACVGGLNGTSGYFVATSSTTDSWRNVLEMITVNPSTQSISFEIGIRKTEDIGSFIAHVDAALLLLDDNVFEDSFE